MTEHPESGRFVLSTGNARGGPGKTSVAMAAACHCLCVMAHSGLGACLGEAEPGLTLSAGTPSGLVGVVDVPMCRPCHGAVVDRFNGAQIGG